MDCLFCKILSGDIPATLIYEDDQVVAFSDVEPQAPHHALIIPRRHIATLNDLNPEDEALVGHMVLTAQHIAKAAHLADDGYRVVMNCNAQAGQAIFHIHLHLLGGRTMTWPPG